MQPGRGSGFGSGGMNPPALGLPGSGYQTPNMGVAPGSGGVRAPGGSPSYFGGGGGGYPNMGVEPGSGGIRGPGGNPSYFGGSNYQYPDMGAVQGQGDPRQAGYGGSPFFGLLGGGQGVPMPFPVPGQGGMRSGGGVGPVGQNFGPSTGGGLPPYMNPIGL